jgi:phenylpropionate dioxygenase-like ring-hydroxylating dioxygenase large terminal subunit
MINPNAVQSDLPDTAVILPVEAYVSAAYARAEDERLWGKVWQVACREEDIPKVGDYYTYDILDESVIVVRSAPDAISAYYNVCLHRGRRLTKGCGHAAKFHCKFHGWQWQLNGENSRVLDPEDWGGALTPESLRLGKVKVDTWGGYVFINLDPHCESLQEFLDPVSEWLDPFELDKMRYRWRQWLYLPCNWKTAIEAFVEGYHVDGTHPQLLPWLDSHTWSRAHGKHSVFGNLPRGAGGKAGLGTTSINNEAGKDARKEAADFMEHLYKTVNANTTETIINAAKRLVDVLPADAQAVDVMNKMMELACKADAERGVIWPTVDPDHYRESGIDWHIFPNTVVLHGITFVLGYRARPNGYDPDSCIFEVYVLERFPEGQEPVTENLYQPDQTEEKWRKVLCQDFANMPEVQRGMKSRGFPGPRPNPRQEQPVINFHRVLAEYMGTGAPRPIPPRPISPGQ